jgi:hypothetical protein
VVEDRIQELKNDVASCIFHCNSNYKESVAYHDNYKEWMEEIQKKQQIKLTWAENSLEKFRTMNSEF